eukprot:c10644_g1_i1.p1 GENE.c10644_g1_i1~~c10644_g1_i1.p1  ORF type:complete len:260 (+),score=43.76 c10644_g1_i1:411-1190(+)
MYRVSENTVEVDFLPNHNSASHDALAAFLTNDIGDGAYLDHASVTQYCVEHLNPEQVGWAPYASCNGPEADPFNNPEDPMCICFVYADRLIALQPKEVFDSRCNPIIWNGTFHDDPICNCSRDGVWSKWVIPERSETYIGMMPVYLPYFYYQVPRTTYPTRTSVGVNYSTPKKGACSPNQSIGDNGCTWKQISIAKVLYIDDLLERGWNTTIQNHWPMHEYGPNTTLQTLQNIDVFQRTWGSVFDEWISPVCCGCEIWG